MVGKLETIVAVSNTSNHERVKGEDDMGEAVCSCVLVSRSSHGVVRLVIRVPHKRHWQMLQRPQVGSGAIKDEEEGDE